MATGYSVPADLPIDLNGRQYQLEKEGVRRHVLPRDRPSVNNSPLGGASSLNPEAGVLRVGTDWSLGAGQEMFDDAESDPRRYYRQDSVQAVRRGRIQIPNQLGQLSSSRGGAIFTLVPWTERSFVQTGNSLFWFEFASPNFTLWRASITAGPYSVPTFNNPITSTATSMLCLATDGTNTTWLTRGGSGVSRATTETGAWTAAWSAVATNVIAYCNGHLLGIVGGTVWEFDNAGAKLGGVDIFTHPNTSWVWQGAVAGAGLIYLWGGAGMENAVYVIDDVLTGGTLAPPKIALPMPAGEYVTHMEPVGGYFVARTNLGIRVFTPNGDILESGPLMLHRPVATDYPNIPICVSAAGGDSVMVAWRNLNSAAGDYISRVDLTRFAGDVPAHHPIEYKPPDGTAANNAIGGIKVAGRVDIPFSQGYLYVLGGNAGGSVRRVWACQMDQVPNSANNLRTRCPSGTFYTGWMTYETQDFKTPIELLFLCESMGSGASIDCYFVDDAGTETLLTSLTPPATGTSVDLTGLALKVRRFQLRFTLNRTSDQTSTPVLESWQVRCRLIPQRQEEIFLPLQLHPVVQGENDQEIDQDPYDEFVALRALVTAGTAVTLKEGSYSQRVFVDDIQLADGTSAMSMDDTAFYEGVYTVRCVGAF
jgi:hypothetical protein